MLSFNPPLIAHRGLSYYAPENTLSAFTKALQQGYQWIECDVMLSSDAEPIIFHDETLERTTDGKGCPGDYPLAYLKTLDAGKWFRPHFSGEGIPVLSEVLELMKNDHFQLNLEIKPLPGQDDLTVIRTLKKIDEYFSPPYARILFSSFSIETLTTLRRLAPTANIALLLHEWRDDWQGICDALQCVSVHVNQEVMTLEIARAIKASKRFLCCYTVNEIERARTLFSWGVDAIFSDAPDRVWPL